MGTRIAADGLQRAACCAKKEYLHEQAIDPDNDPGGACAVPDVGVQQAGQQHEHTGRYIVDPECLQPHGLGFRALSR